MPSISGIMMSISTMSIVGSALDQADRLAAVVGRDDDHALLVEHGGQREDVAHVVVDDQRLLALQAVLALDLSIPITLLMAPMERIMMERIIESGRMPPEFREYAGTYVGGAIRLAVGFFFMLVVGSMVAALGGLLGSLIFKQPLPPGTIDRPPGQV